MSHSFHRIAFMGLVVLCCSSMSLAQCPDGETLDCNGNCAPIAWIGDGTCDNGAFDYNGVPIYFNCMEFSCDGGDCPDNDCEGGGGEKSAACCLDGYCHELPEEQCYDWGGKFYAGLTCDLVVCYPSTGACCIAGNCSETSNTDCYTSGGAFYPDVTCSDVTCEGGGSNCPDGEIEDCNGNCAPIEWLGDGECDDGAYEYDGVLIFFNCDELNCDNGDCDCGSEPSGACCWGIYCLESTQSECDSYDGGTWLGEGVSCDSASCSADPGACCVDGSCMLTWENDCISLNGEYYGNGMPCEAVPCLPSTIVGGCCLPDGTCDQYTDDECAALEGTFAGGGVACDEVACFSCPGDVDGDADVGINDLLAVIDHWGTTEDVTDINGDGVVDVDDMLVVISEWGPCIPDRYTGSAEELLGTLQTMDGGSVPIEVQLQWDLALPQEQAKPGIVIPELRRFAVGGDGVDDAFDQAQDVTIDITESSGIFDIESGRLEITGTADYLCPAFDEFVEPVFPYPGADHTEHASQGGEFTLTAILDGYPNGPLMVTEGQFSWSVTEPEPWFEIFEASFPIKGMSLAKKVYSNTSCKADRRCNKKTLCIQPVIIKYQNNSGADEHTGTSLDEFKTDANTVWAKACVEFEWKESVVLENVDSLVNVTSSSNRLSTEERELLSKHDASDCIEVFFVSRFTPRHSRGGGFCVGGGTKSTKIVVTDDVVDNCTPKAVQLFTHEVGHAMNLKHTDSDDTVMTPTGKGPPNCPGAKPNANVRKKQMDDLKNPLLKEKTPKEECCQQPD